MVDCMTDLYFAPTNISKENLLKEDIKEEKIFVTGNTAIDAMSTTVKNDYTHPELEWIKPNEKNDTFNSPQKRKFRTSQ